MIFRRGLPEISFSVVLLVSASSGVAQTYQISPATGKPAPQADQPQSAGQQLGFGSNIQNARLARAAELALQKGDHALAYSYASRAAQAAPNDPQLWYLLGYAARLDGKYGPSAEAYQHGLKLKSTIEGLSGLAQTYSLSGRTDEAERLLKQVVAAAPDRRDDLAELGEIYMKSGNYEGALEWLNRAEHVTPTAQSELLLAVAYEHLKQLDQASHYLELARSRSPNNPDVERSLAAYYRDTGNFDKAVEALMAIRNPRPDAIAELAYTYTLDSKFDDAARVYSEAANMLPRDLNLQLSAAQAQVTIHAFDRAGQFLRRAAEISPNYYRLHAIRGEIAQLQDNEAEAAREFSTAVSNLPAAPVEGPLYGIQLHMNLVSLYASLDENDLSKQQLALAAAKINTLDEQRPDRASYLRLRALIRMDQGHLEEALKDMTAALALTPRDPNSLQLEGDLLMRMGRTQDAIVVFQKVLDLDPHSRFALTSLGYASRAAGDDASAEKYFTLLAKDYPTSYVPFLALGDLYTSRHQYTRAETAYSQGFKLAPANSLIVAGGMNASIEAHDIPLAGTWQARVTEKMSSAPQILREEERYFSFKNDPQQSASFGRRAIKLLPDDRDVVIYLGYDFLRLEDWDELKQLTAEYNQRFPKEPDLPLLEGYLNKHDGDLETAVTNFSEALRRDPNVVTAYTNLGFVLNDLHEPAKAAPNFEEALKREPNNVEAHMGLAFADLNLEHWQAAIHQTELAEAVAGDSELLHTIRATAYGREGLLSKSAAEYTAALKFDPTDGSLYLGISNIDFAERRYPESLVQTSEAAKYLPHDPAVFALMARDNAYLHNREETLHDVQLAEQYLQQLPPEPKRRVATKDLDPAKSLDKTAEETSEVYVATGEALSTIGDQAAALQRFTKALSVKGSDRVAVRLAIADLMADQNHAEDAERQIALAQMEVTAGDTRPATGGQLIQAANTFQHLHEYELAETYLDQAKAAGAPDANVRIGLANSYLALGETRRAAAELAAVKQSEDGELDYQYLLAEASLYEQEHQSTQALTAFATAATDAGEDQTADQGLLQAGSDEGFRVTPKLSLLSNLIVQPIFEDSTVYVLDSKLNSPAGPVPQSNVSLLPPPRSSIETNLINSFHLHLDHLPTNGGFLQVRNAQGTISVPATASIQPRNTTDISLNFGLDPTVHLGNNVVTFNSGVQGTIRRDTQSPIELDQNLFRVFTYATTSSFYNALSADGYVAYEFGPFTNQPINEHDLTGAFNFRVGAPWSRTALVTGWGANNQQFNSAPLGNRQNYYTTSYIGLTHRFSTKLSAEAIVEDLRAFRVVPFSPIHTAIAQALRPAGTVDFKPNPHWDIQVSSAYENTRGFHVYDMLENGIAVGYTRPFERTFNDATGKLHLKYPIRFAGGFREETFPNFSQGPRQQFRPYVSLTLF